MSSDRHQIAFGHRSYITKVETCQVKHMSNNVDTTRPNRWPRRNNIFVKAQDVDELTRLTDHTRITHFEAKRLYYGIQSTCSAVTFASFAAFLSSCCQLLKILNFFHSKVYFICKWGHISLTKVIDEHFNTIYYQFQSRPFWPYTFRGNGKVWYRILKGYGNEKIFISYTYSNRIISQFFSLKARVHQPSRPTTCLQWRMTFIPLSNRLYYGK